MTRKFCKERYASLEEELALYADMGMLSVKKLSGALASITKALEDLKAYIIQHPFANNDEEIYFFKYEKPRFLSHQIYLLEQFTMESQKPQGDVDSLRNYYQQELKFVQRFFDQYKFQYGYYQAEATEMDDKYFLREAGPISMVMPVLPDRHPEFSTNADYLFAKFKAYERLQTDLLEQLTVSEMEAVKPMVSKKGRQLKWTGDTCNLIELVYGIYETKQVNEGDVDLSDLMDVFEQCFQVNLSRYFRRFTEIKRRKTMSKTRYLDEMCTAVNKRIDDGDALVPDKAPGRFNY